MMDTLRWQLHVILEALAYFIGAGVILYFLDKLGYGLESLIKISQLHSRPETG